MSALHHARIGQIAVICRDVARARAFYKDMLGLRHLFDAGPDLAFFDCGGTRLMLSPAEGDASGTSVLYFFITDIGGTKHDLAAKGVQFIDEPHIIARMPDYELWLAEFRDCEGNVMALMEERQRR